MTNLLEDASEKQILQGESNVLVHRRRALKTPRQYGSYATTYFLEYSSF